MKVWAFVLAHNQDRWIKTVIENAARAADYMTVIHHESDDDTDDRIHDADTGRCFAAVEKYHDLRYAHRAVAPHAGEPVWAWQIDGDEIYDPAGLKQLADQCRAGLHDDVWRIHGRYLHVTSINHDDRTVTGHLHQGKCGANFYNLSHLERWDADGRRAPFMSADIAFKPGRNPQRRDREHERAQWNQSLMRCLHMRFMRQTSRVRDDEGARRSANQVCGWGLGVQETGRDPKANHRLSYRQGPVVTVDATPFGLPRDREGVEHEAQKEAVV